MKEGEPSAFNGTFRFAGTTINLKNVWGKPMGFVLLAFVIGATISQGSFAFADDSATNPFRAIWEAIGELQVKTDSLQAQIDDLKAQGGTTVTAAQIVKISDSSIAIDVTGGGSGQTVVTFIVRNAGPDSAVGGKLAAFYQTSLFQVNFVQGAECSDGSRGIIECYLGTLAPGSEARVTVDANPISLDQQAIITADFSSITRDANPADNHAETVFITAIAPIAQPAPAPAVPSGGGSAPVEQAPVEQEQTEQGSEETEQTQEQATEGTPESGETQTSQEAEQSSEQTDQGMEQTESGEATGEQGEGSGESSGESTEGATGDSGTEGESSGDAGTGGETGGSGDTGGGDAGSDGGAGDSGTSGDSGSEGGSSGDGSSSSGDSGSDGGSSGGDSGTTG